MTLTAYFVSWLELALPFSRSPHVFPPESRSMPVPWLASCPVSTRRGTGLETVCTMAAVTKPQLGQEKDEEKEP